jgi:type II secretory pathway pseudopilin PulG
VVEMMIVMVLMSAFIVAALVNGAMGVKQADTSGVAEIFASNLRAARQQAVTRSIPVAVVIPSQAGSRPHSQSFYQVTGDNPRISSVTNLAPEHPGTCLAAGVVLPASIIQKTELANSSQKFDFPVWLASAGLEKDYVFCFLPDGTVTTNDLPLADGAYNILVSLGLSFGAASAPTGDGWGTPPSYFEVTEVSSPRLVRLSPSGEVSVRDSIPGIQISRNLEFSETPAPPPELTAASTITPELLDIQVRPKPDPATVPPGIEALVDVDGHLTLEVVASDSDPEELLYCSWLSDRGGAFSRPDLHQMSWVQDAVDPGVGAWVSTVVWRPPPGTAGGELFTLSADVFDPDGRTDGSKLGVSGVVQTIDEETIVFESVRDGRAGLFTMLPDGSGVRRVGDPGQHDAILSPTGQVVVFAQGDSLYLKPLGGEPLELISMPAEPTGGPFATAGNIEPEGFNSTGTLLFWTVGNSAYVGEVNGISPITSYYRLNADPGWVDPLAVKRKVDLSMSPDGSTLVYDNGFHLYAAQFDPSPAAGQPYLPGGNTDITVGFAAGDARWSEDSSKLVFVSDNAGNLDVFTLDFNTGTGTFSNARNISNNAAQDGFGAFSPDGTRLVYGSIRSGNWELYRVNADGSGEVNITNHPSDDVRPMWGR